MVKRRFWLNLIEQGWREKPVVWLAGVRRVGKTCLCQSLPDVEYFDCELPRVRRQYPQGDNVVVAQDVERPFVRNYGDLKVHFEALASLVKRIAGAGRG